MVVDGKMRRSESWVEAARKQREKAEAAAMAEENWTERDREKDMDRTEALKWERWHMDDNELYYSYRPTRRGTYERRYFPDLSAMSRSETEKGA